MISPEGTRSRAVGERKILLSPNRRPRRALACPLLFAALAVIPHSLHAQAGAPGSQAESTPAPHTSSIIVRARLVVLDVVVTDKNGNAVDNLTANDFQVFEDGRLQRIRSVEPPSAHVLPPETAAAGAAAVLDPAQPASFGHAPVTILLLDQLNTHFADSSFARRALHDYLVKQPPVLAQPATLLSLSDNRLNLLQGFTLDRDALLHALAATPTKYAWELEVNGKADHGPIDRLDQSLHALEAIAQNYAAIQGRKNLIWVGGGFPTLDPATITSPDAREVKDTLQHVTDVLLDTRVTLYAVDPSSSLPEITNDEQQMFALATGGDNMAAAADPFGSQDDFNALGPVTGGRVVRGRNDVAQLIGASVQSGASFYTIAYSPDSASEAVAAYRKIKVVCLRPGLTATTRSGYYTGRSEQERSVSSAAYDLTAAAEGPLPLNGLHVTATPDPSPAAAPDTYIVRVSASQLTWQPKDDGASTASVYIMAVSFNAKSRMLNHTLHGMLANAKPNVDLRDPHRLADFVFTATPAPKATGLRFIVRDSATGRMGSIDLTLPKR
jgi:VWFA-related protein